MQTEPPPSKHGKMRVRRQSFPRWVFSKLDAIRKAAGVALVIAAIGVSQNVGLFEWALGGVSSQGSTQPIELPKPTALLLLQAVACLILAIITPRPSTARLLSADPTDADNEARRSTASRACLRIRTHLVVVFFLWCSYYLVQAASSHYGPSPDWAARGFTLGLSSLTALSLFWLYLELAEVTIRVTSETGTTSAPQLPSSRAQHHRLVSLGLLFALLTLIAYACANALQGLTVLIEVIVGCASGVSLCLVVGRLGHQYLNPGPVTLALLYLYGVIQPAGAMFDREPALYVIATSMALPLKTILWLVGVWAFTTGVLAEYVYEIRVLVEKQVGDDEEK